MNIFRPFGELEFILPDIAFTDENRKCQAAFVCLQHVAFKAWKQIFIASIAFGTVGARYLNSRPKTLIMGP